MRDLDDVFVALSASAFRRKFRLDGRDAQYLRMRGLTVVLEHARDLIARRLAPAEPDKDGRQTPWRGHQVFVAQHATATCCRGCLAKWHGIPKGQPLSAEQQEYVIAALGRWLRQQAAAAPRTERVTP
jgi:hypothetical protein